MKQLTYSFLSRYGIVTLYISETTHFFFLFSMCDCNYFKVKYYKSFKILYKIILKIKMSMWNCKIKVKWKLTNGDFLNYLKLRKKIGIDYRDSHKKCTYLGHPKQPLMETNQWRFLNCLKLRNFNNLYKFKRKVYFI